MYMYKDCNFFNILKIHLYFTSYKDKFKTVKQKNHLKNNFNMHTYTTNKNQREKFKI
jgi:hypothetical protein